MSLKNTPANQWLFDQVADTQRVKVEEGLPVEESHFITPENLHTIPCPEWLPDWKKKDAYPDHGDDLRAWAWEFLRRNPEYQADYAHYMSVPWCYPNGGGKTPKLARGTYPADDDEMIFFDREPPAAYPSETFGEYVRRTGREPERLETSLLHKWRLVVLNDPAEPEPIWLAADERIPPFDLQQSHGRVFLDYFDKPLDRAKQHPREWPGREVILADWPEEYDDHMHVFAFDARLPLDAQMARAKQMIKEAEDTESISLSRPSPRKLVEYLRVFDAIWTVGWNRRQAIAAEIWQNIDKKSAEKRADDARGEGFRLVNGGYYADHLKWADFPKNLNK